MTPDLLQSLCEEEALLHVVVGGRGGVNVSDAREASFHPAVLLQGLGEEQSPQQAPEVWGNPPTTSSCIPNPAPGLLSLTEECRVTPGNQPGSGGTAGEQQPPELADGLMAVQPSRGNRTSTMELTHCTEAL